MLSDTPGSNSTFNRLASPACHLHTAWRPTRVGVLPVAQSVGQIRGSWGLREICQAYLRREILLGLGVVGFPGSGEEGFRFSAPRWQDSIILLLRTSNSGLHWSPLLHHVPFQGVFAALAIHSSGKGSPLGSGIKS